MRMKLILIVTLAQLLCASVWATCEVVNPDGTKTPFDGTNLANLSVEKQSLITLNKTFPALNAMEKAFKGEVVMCTNCTDRHVTCSK